MRESHNRRNRFLSHYGWMETTIIYSKILTAMEFLSHYGWMETRSAAVRGGTPPRF